MILPIGVVIPTRNSMAHLRGHLESAALWAPLVQEIIVVDSESTDGTPELIRDRLKHPHLQIFSRPRGLYQAWNFGVSQVKSPYVYISTIGDTMTAAGLTHLASMAESLKSDVAISPPSFIDEQGRPVEHFQWPIQRIIKSLGISQPQSLSQIQTIVCALANGMNSFLGSSASNLYRTEVLQKRPFPLTFGHMGDTGWGIAHCAALKVAVTPTVCSTFLFHAKETEPDYSALAPELLRLAQEMKTSFLADEGLRGEPDAMLACDLLKETALECCYQNDINVARAQQPGFFFNYHAWLARLRRNRQRRRIRQLRTRFQNQPLV